MMKIKIVSGDIAVIIDTDAAYYMSARGNGKTQIPLWKLVDSLKLKWYQKLWLGARYKIWLK